MKMALMIQINIPEYRKIEIKNAVLLALQNSNAFSLPVKIKAVARSFPNIRLIPFSKHMRCFHLSYNQMITFVESKDACTDFYANKNLYYIYYNDVDASVTTSNRYRWNIAHELGHILLKHHVNNQKTRIFRSSLTDTEYNELEAEADYFAQLILVPHAVLIGFKVDTYRTIRYMCKISDPAAKRRFYEYSIWKKHINPNDFYDSKLFSLFYSFIFKRECKNCGAMLIQRYGKYCPICGKKTLQWGDGKMIYPKMETYDNGKLKRCPKCDNEETEIEGNFCQICSNYLVNECMNENCSNCGKVLPTNARFCPVCGGDSLFFNNDILKIWNYSTSSRINSFINIPDGEEEDELPFI
ncbi:MAG: ImmA/IrrE family metallo-endopeptidase [Enterocloster clostridioformis]|uniref:ImmA/IrrE family metallo-endopeptidase n=1 Tax=Enterocloster clostridioformis TaxID=1531 RepID=UPI00242B73E7|nr:ImmA/IrrE family metallo-endopeptidase [Enterocloster clostridioformis]MDY4763519.1 ImmA/IrrE family metallo-endopeptidase [Enterocloster clostridioformis]